MPNITHRYRITVTPVEEDGMQCHGRCTMEFQHRSSDDWMRVLETMQQQRGLSGDERAALTVATRLLSGLMLDRRKDADARFALLQPLLDEFISSLEPRTADAETRLAPVRSDGVPRR